MAMTQSDNRKDPLHNGKMVDVWLPCGNDKQWFLIAIIVST
jgi:hypothetical protein